MKVIERKTIHEAPERLPELPAGVTVPDDLSGLELRKGVGRRPTATAVRWLRWLPVVLLLVVGAIAVGVYTADEAGETIAPSAVPWEINDGPGSNSVNDAVATQAIPVPSVGPWTGNDGPGSTSLNTTTPSVSPWTGNDGPGSHSL